MPARHAILGLLIQQPLHGYDIDGEFEKGLRSICHVNISQIYAYLKSMEERGWVESETVIQKSNPPKKVFHVTQAGRNEMQRWLNRPVKEVREMRDELLTKIFFCWKLTPDKLPELLEDQIEIHRRQLEEIEERLQQHNEPLMAAFFDARLRHARADYEWLLWVREQINHQVGEEPTALSAQR